MDFFKIIGDEILRFFSIAPLIGILKSGDYSSLLTLAGIKALLSPLIPFLLLIEIARSAVYRQFKLDDIRVPMLTYIFNRFVSRFIAIAATAWCIGFFEPLAIFKTEFTWYWFVYGYVVWEFGHFIYHWLGHKVRLFWCLHSTHHAPETMNLSVTYAHFFLEAPFADVVRTTACILLGVNPPMLFFIMFIDGLWGSFIHVGEGMLQNGRLGFLEKIVLTPSHHRVHHARNPLYMDTNFCNLLNVWDKIFGTYQPENQAVNVEYGITRPVNSQNFWDANFGEFLALAHDVWAAPGFLNKVLYVFMPPGWHHSGEHKTASVLRQNWLRDLD